MFLFKKKFDNDGKWNEKESKHHLLLKNYSWWSVWHRNWSIINLMWKIILDKAPYLYQKHFLWAKGSSNDDDKRTMTYLFVTRLILNFVAWFSSAKENKMMTATEERQHCRGKGKVEILKVLTINWRGKFTFLLPPVPWKGNSGLLNKLQQNGHFLWT